MYYNTKSSDVKRWEPPIFELVDIEEFVHEVNLDIAFASNSSGSGGGTCLGPSSTCDSD